jgi:glycosyltransferase involved in cell wall biosynthesis
MHICIVWDSILSLEKSSKGDISQIVEMTSALAQEGVDVSLVALNAGRIKIDGARIIQVPRLWYVRQRTRILGRLFPKLYGHESTGNARHVAKFVTSILDPAEHYDLYHVRNPYLAIELKRMQPYKPLVYNAIPRFFHSKSERDKLIDQKAIDVSDVLITFTEAWRKYVIKTFNLQGREVTVVPVCVNSDSFIHEAHDLPKRMKGRKTIGYFGRLQKTYGIDTLIEVIPDLKRRVHDVGIIIAGGGVKKYDDELKRIAKNLGVEEETYFAGEIPHDLMPGYIRMCRVLVSFRYDEIRHRYGFDVSIPIKCVEYIMQGKPVVATRDGGMELLLGKDYPYLIEPGDKGQIVNSLERLLTDDKEAERIGLENKRISSKYTYEAVADKLIKVYKQVMPNSRKEHKDAI